MKMENTQLCSLAIQLATCLYTHSLIIVQSTAPPTPSKSVFSVFWNVPSQRCAFNYGIDINVTKYGIKSNCHDGWAGEYITIFPHPGLYPHVINGSQLNGGIPQNVNLKQHLAQLRHDIEVRIPNNYFHGLSVIDYEAWQPLFSLNFDTRRVYQQLSMDLVKRQHPDWTEKQVTAEAIREFEQSARVFLEFSMMAAIASRPAGKWGLYHYPYCFNGDKCVVDKVECPQFAKEANDRLMWLFKSQRVLFPSAYLHSSANSTCNRMFVNARLQEAKRVQKSASVNGSQLPLYLYSNLCYREDGHFYKLVDLNNTIAVALEAGANGVVLWADHNLSKKKSICLKLQHYVDTVLGPFVFNLLHHRN